MKKVIFGGLIVLVVAIAATVNVNVGNENGALGNVSLANVEALASEGGSSARADCYSDIEFTGIAADKVKSCKSSIKSCSTSVSNYKKTSNWTCP